MNVSSARYAWRCVAFACSYYMSSSGFQIVTRGVACTTAKCQTRMHQHCFTKLRARHARTQCPTCQCDWPQDANALRAVGEAAIRDGQPEGRRVRRKSTAEASDAESEGDNRMDEDEPEPSQPSPPQQRRKQKKKAVAMDDGDEEEEEEAPRRSGRRG